MRAVVLVQGAGAHQPQVTTGDEPAFVEDLVLRLDGHLADCSPEAVSPVNAPDDGRTRCQAARGGPSSPTGT